MERAPHESPLKKAGRAIGHLLTGPHCLASHGDHFNDDPLATAPRMWTDSGKPIPFPDGEPTQEFDPYQLRLILGEREE